MSNAGSAGTSRKPHERMTSEAQLFRGLDALGVELARVQIEKLLAYVALLAKWNKVHNLTAVREESRMVSHHVLDSLAVLPHIAAEQMLDVGSGGGLPGIPLAIARGEMRVTLLDSNKKKSTFLKQAAIELELVNVRVVSSRVEEFEYPPGFDVVISRAFSDLGEFVLAARHLVTAGGLLAAMKGVYPHEELTHLPAGFSLKRSIPLEVPGVNAKRHLLLVGAT